MSKELSFRHSQDIYLTNIENSHWIHKAPKITGEFLGNKIDDKIVKLKLVSDGNLRNVEETIISPEKREELFN